MSNTIEKQDENPKLIIVTERHFETSLYIELIEGGDKVFLHWI